MRYRLIISLAVVLAILIAEHSTASTSSTIFTSTRCVTGIAVAKDGSLWVSTRGGVLHQSADGSWQKYTQLDGLPSNEALSVQADDVITVAFPSSRAVLVDNHWQIEQIKPDSAVKEVVCSAMWQGKKVTATLTNIKIGEKSVPLPSSTGSHISAMLAYKEKLWAAMFGDGIWEYGGKSWSRVNINLPESAREITAMAADGDILWLGTQRETLWEYDGSKWRQHLQPDEPYDTNCQNMLSYKGSLFVSTLEDGLAVRTSGGWRHYNTPDISSNAPRQMVEFKDCLYVRHGSGKIDRFDGEKWTRNVFTNLPRKQASAIAVDANRLYVAQWGGWSEFDGSTWTHFLKNSELQGYPITALYPDGEKLWIGTQGRGLAEVDKSTGNLKWHDERLGLTDDWVKHILQADNKLFCGTFIGGLTGFDGTKWNQTPEIGSTEITAMISDGASGLYIATREGIWHKKADSTIARIESSAKEAQALCLVNNKLWIGTRTGIYVNQF